MNVDRVVNYMDGLNYTMDPMKKLLFVMASSIVGEPQYYRDGNKNKKTMPESYLRCMLFPELNNKNTMEIAIEIINNALNVNFAETLNLAVKLRNEYMMRKNPQLILVLALLHEKRQEFDIQNPKFMREIIQKISLRPDDMYTQFEFYKLIANMGKKKLPGILKKGWCDVLENLSNYQLKKYLKKGHIIDLIRMSHPNPTKNQSLTEIIKTGDLSIQDEEKTWEMLRSSGVSWKDILQQIHIPHMALLRNLKNIMLEISIDEIQLQDIINKLVKGVTSGKQFPFRYYTAYKMIQDHHIEPINLGNMENKKNIILKGLESCMTESLKNYPKLKGDTLSLVDNSGSARSSFNSSYGSTQISTIANLSGLLTAINCEGRGVVGVFGDNLILYEVDKSAPILEQLNKIENIGNTVGQSTENGIWIYFNKALSGDTNMLFNNIFIYSDQQCGTGGLYGKDPKEYREYTWNNTNYIDLLQLLKDYREKVNKNVNVFSIQVAGYDNSILPDNIYRGAIMSGWTGAESLYASEIIKLWDELENN